MFELPAIPDWTHPALNHCAAAGLLTHNATPALIARHAAGRIVYLATPYVDDIAGDANGMPFDLDASIACGDAAMACARELVLAGVTALPVAALMAGMVQADMDEFRLDPLDREFWACWSAPFLRGAGAVAIAPVPGWNASAEVWAVLRWALGLRTPVFVMGEMP
ncbi:DUF1937 family protein [Chachezhania antarctica]|uniref:DUF1937 family protein n=1 Tax=Chachezhania antarctica TaxID=2340860 RepID=UPI000EAFC467|nr:DUF1937 family protein [Chachezhania antarctica]